MAQKSNKPRTVLVVGATGSVGRHAVAEALRQGYETRALVRDASRAGRMDPGAHLVIGELTRPETLDSYDETIERNRREQAADARPRMANALPEVAQYDTMLLGSPVWNIRAPMLISTFLDAVDLSGKSVLPFATYAVSGMGIIEKGYRDMLTYAEVRTGLAVRGEEVAGSGAEADEWLRESGLFG